MINIKMAWLLNQRSCKPLFLCFWLDFWDKRHAWSDEDIFRDIQSVQKEGKSTFMQIACGLTLFQCLMNKLATTFDETRWSSIWGVMQTVHEHWLSSTLFSRAWNNWKCSNQNASYEFYYCCACAEAVVTTKQPVIRSVWRKLSRICTQIPVYTHTVTMAAVYLWTACL